MIEELRGGKGRGRGGAGGVVVGEGDGGDEASDRRQGKPSFELLRWGGVDALGVGRTARVWAQQKALHHLTRLRREEWVRPAGRQGNTYGR